MTDAVKCRVCGREAPLGTLECPDCGAPLPRELPRAPQPPSAAEKADQGARTPAKGPKETSPKRRRLQWAAAFLAVCLAAQLTAALWPQRPAPPGVYWGGGALVTPQGVWDYEGEDLFFWDATSDGRYVLLQGMGDPESLSGLRGLSAVLTDVSMSYTYAPTGDYYLFDGRALERTDWTRADLTDAGTVFYTQEDETGVTLGWRDLNTGKDRTVDIFGGAGYLDFLRPSPDGTAAAYRWLATDAETDGNGGGYRLWRAKDGRSAALDVSGGVLGVGRGGETCLLWDAAGEYPYGWDGDRNYGAPRDYRHLLWRDGERTELPDMSIIWVNDRCTQFLLRWDSGNEGLPAGTAGTGAWYYFDADAMTQPLRLDLPADNYLMHASLYENETFDTLPGHFYLSYGMGGNRVYYLTQRGELLLAVDSLDGNFQMDAAEQSAAYLKGGDLYRLNVHPGDTLETARLTSGPDSGSVTAFAANEDLSHIYYQARSQENYIRKALYHWHGGESHALDLELNANYGNVPLTVTDGGGCYFTYARDLYYTEGDAPPALLLEEIGMSASVALVGPEKWPLLPGAVWVGGEKQARHWRLNGYDAPVELTEWYPKEGEI